LRAQAQANRQASADASTTNRQELACSVSYGGPAARPNAQRIEQLGTHSVELAIFCGSPGPTSKDAEA